DLVVRATRLHGTVIEPEEVPAAIDELPVLMVAAACASGETRLSGAAELRLKESDRLAALEQLAALGVPMTTRPDGLTLQGLDGRWPRGASMRRVIIASRWRSPSPGFGPRAVWRSPIRSASRCPSRASSSSSRDLALRWVPPDGTDRRRDRRAGRRRKEHREPGAGAAAGVGLCRYGSHVPCGGCARCGVWHRARRRRGARAIRGGTVVRAARWRDRPRRRRA